ncbi:MAG: hypothetical protein AB1641_29735 [Thermodesulfobacteriota bacterium]
MPDNREPSGQINPQRIFSIKEDGYYYANCALIEATPFDLSIVLGKVRPSVDEKGQRVLVEVYERQVYLSHLQARVLYEALAKTLGSLGRVQTAGPRNL